MCLMQKLINSFWTLGIADKVYGGDYYEMGLIDNTPDEDLPLIISQLKTDEGKQELERRLKS
jgi:hypothetical protein